jgi:hypothetical protein
MRLNAKLPLLNLAYQTNILYTTTATLKYPLQQYSILVAVSVKAAAGPLLTSNSVSEVEFCSIYGCTTTSTHVVCVDPLVGGSHFRRTLSDA